MTELGTVGDMCDLVFSRNVNLKRLLFPLRNLQVIGMSNFLISEVNVYFIL